MRVLICGSRTWDDYHRVLEALRRIHEVTPVEVVIEGEARGADTLGRQAAEELAIPVLKFPADWNKYGKAAGPIRNQQMLEEGKPTYFLAFANPTLEATKGTKDMVTRLRKANIGGFVTEL